MGLCQCIARDNMTQKTVDLKSLKNDLQNSEKEPRTAPKNLIDKTCEISQINETVHNQEKDNYIKPEQQIDNCVNRNMNYVQVNKPASASASASANAISNEIKKQLNKDDKHLFLNQQQQHQQIQLESKALSDINKTHQEIISEIIKTNSNSNDNNTNNNNNEAFQDSKITSTKKTVSRFLNRKHINIVILGGKGVGKSAFVIKFIENIFEKLYIPTLGVEVRRKKYSYNTHLYDLNFIVTSGNDYKSDYSKAYETVDFFLVFYDITSMDSFKEAKKILREEVKNYVYSYTPTMTNVFLVGNKIDCGPRTVSEEVAITFCQKNEFQMFDISVKTNKNIPNMMKALIKTVDDIAYLSE